MTGTRQLERLTASDLFLLLWDDYGWSTDIGELAILDGTSLLDEQGRVHVDAVRRHLEPGPSGRSIPPARCGSCGCCPACQTADASDQDAQTDNSEWRLLICLPYAPARQPGNEDPQA